MASDERGQMMLLAAVVLLIAFMSLTVMVGRLGTIAAETARAEEGGFLREVRMVRAVFAAPFDIDSTTEFQALADFEASRGYSLTCTDGGSADVLVLTDGVSRSTFSIPLTTPDDLC